MIVIPILAVLVLLLAAGWLYQQISLRRDMRRYPAPGRLVDIGGYRLHMQISGEGEPVVILEAGFGDFSIHWQEIQERLEEHTRVVSYDRAGMGWSDASPHARKPSQVAAELYHALKQAGIEGPYIIMGHSLGGIFARHFARNHLDEMAGVLLLDSTHEKDELPEEMRYVYRNLSRSINIGSLLVPVGISRLLGALSRKERTQTQELERALALNPKTYRAYRGEFDNVLNLPEPFAAGSLGDVPLVVLYAEANITVEGIKDKVKSPEKIVEQVRAAVRAGNEQLGTLSSRSEVLMSPAGHYIQRDDPDLVMRKIRELIDISGELSS